MTRKKTAIRNGVTFVCATVLSLSITAGVTLEAFSSTIDSVLGTKSYITKSDDSGDGQLYSTFKPKDVFLNADGTGNSKAFIQEGIDLDRRLVGEGSVLLKNNNDALPMSAGNKVTLLGVRSHVPLLGAQMGNKVQGGMISLEGALGTENQTHFERSANRFSGGSGTFDNCKFDGANFELNPTMIDVYDSINEDLGLSYCDGSSNVYDPKEPSLFQLAAANPSFQKSFASYNDAAIVVLSRPGTEGTDYLPGGVANGTGASDPLELTTNERALIELATSKDSGFKKVVVLINSSNPMEIGELKDNPKIDSILWVGFPGAYGTVGIADVLTGKANPSGGLSDTFAVKNTSAPASLNMGDYTFSNTQEITRTSFSSKYVIEAEGMYVGYRYYESRYYDCVLDQGNANSTAGAVASVGNWTYGEEVAYSFGYGLSYTKFEREIVSATVNQKKNGITIDFTVKVKNIDEKDGKTSVQIYGQAPYTLGGVEKSAIQLLAFEKTDVIKANSETTVTVTADLQNIASYDSTITNADGTRGSYILDAGDYYFATGNGVHDALNNILAKQGKTPQNTANRMDAEGNSDAAYQWSYTGDNGKVDATTFAITKSGASVSNHLDYADMNYYSPGSVVYLSRRDWLATYPRTYDSFVASKTLRDDLNALSDYYYKAKDTGDQEKPEWNSTKTNHQFYEMTGKSYDDPVWEEMLPQMTLEEAMYFGCYGGPIFPAIPTLGVVEGYLLENSGNGASVNLRDTKDPQAPWAIPETDNNAKWNGEIFPSAPLVAATFNPDLMKEEGEFIGNEALFLGLSILWGPGLNTHRNVYNGRNNEYYSEDPVLAGVAAMEFSVGALEYGLIAAPKHFAFNDQETNRKGVAPFMTEQRAREVELRAYQIAIEADKYDEFDEATGEKTKDVGMLGLMISFSKLGGVECTCSHGLLTDILRGEWGFHGYSVTDIQDDIDLFASEVYAGITGIDIRGAQSFYTGTIITKTLGTQADGSSITVDLFAKDANLQQALRNSNHDLLWAFSQSNLMNRYNASTVTVWNFTWWRGVYFAMIGVSGVLTVLCFASYVVAWKKDEKEGRAE